MAITVDWPTKVVTVPQADLTLISGSLYELDLDEFRLALKAIEASEEGMPFDDIHSHNTTVTIAGTVLARVVEIINGYTITFENLQYAVNLVGANSNIAEVQNINQVSTRSFNTAGLIQITSGSGLSASEQAQLDRAELVYKIFLNKAVTTDIGGGAKRVDFYDDNQTTIIDSITISSDGKTRTNP